ncbi:hypothetical protein ABTX81_05305 [Kitasatospora sp. NPDC097605]|uniref:hypothetical protein n=1 Tax=Kitasatospora sp. NPDC097605 TaxID=3157226 RepID=UPI0033176C7E
MTTPHDDDTEPSVYADAGAGAVLALPGPGTPAHDPAPSWWTALVDAAMADPAADPGPDGGDDLDAVLEGIVIPAPTAPPAQDIPPPPRVIRGQAEKPTPAPAAPVAPPVAPAPPTPPPAPAAPPVPPVPPTPPAPPTPPPRVPTAPAGGGSGQVPPPPAAPADAAPSPDQQPDGDGQGPQDVTPPAWWTSGARRAATDRVAREVGGPYAARTAARVAPLFDVPDTEDGAEPVKKPSRAERDKARDAAGAERARRFRRWAALTVLSAGIGAEVRLPQAMGAVISGVWEQSGQWAGTGAAGFLLTITWSVDWYLRGGTREQGATRIGDVCRARLPFLVVVRVPFASALIAGLGADGLLDAVNLSVHQLFA